MGGTMRLGAYPCELVKDSKAAKAYKKTKISERHRHRYEFNNAYRTQFTETGYVISGTSPDGRLVEIIEYPNHPYFVATQFHPEFHSRPNKPHPLFLGLVKAAILYHANKTASALEKRFPDAVHQGVIAEVSALSAFTEADLDTLLLESNTPICLLILDGITDPHNLGACIRSADAAGVHCIITPKDNSARITPIVSKVSSGATEVVPLLQVTNLARTMDKLKQAGVWLFGAAGEAEKTIYAIDFKGPMAIVLGAEGSGLRRLTRDHCDELFSLPMYGSVSSLNVSVATGICLYEAMRQRMIGAA
jgi:23S rRNA (guanosine2251-2'-O)-methyltransferase